MAKIDAIDFTLLIVNEIGDDDYIFARRIMAEIPSLIYVNGEWQWNGSPNPAPESVIRGMVASRLELDNRSLARTTAVVQALRDLVVTYKLP